MKEAEMNIVWVFSALERTVYEGQKRRNLDRLGNAQNEYFGSNYKYVFHYEHEFTHFCIKNGKLFMHFAWKSEDLLSYDQCIEF